MGRLRAENARLLKLTPQQAAPPGPAQAAYFEAPPGLVNDRSSPQAEVAFYAALFVSRRYPAQPGRAKRRGSLVTLRSPLGEGTSLVIELPLEPAGS